MTKKRVGLVLEGGGAKGAYQFGVIQALHDNGVCFEAIAGTSVGALNALIYGTRQLEKGREFWSGLSFNGIVEWNKPRRIKIPVSLARLFAQYIKFCALSKYKNRKRYHKLIVLTIQLIISCCFFLLSSIGTKIARFLFPIPPNNFISSETSFAIIFLNPVLIKFALIGLIISSFFYIFLKLPDWLAATGISAQNHHPLEQKVGEILNSPLQCPVFITTAYPETLFNPREKVGLDDLLPSERAQKLILYLSKFTPQHDQVRYMVDFAKEHECEIAHPTYCRKYIKLNDLSNNLQARYTLASAALPFGLVAPQEIEGTQFVDGGVVDNCPVYPLIEQSHDWPGCDQIIVVKLEPAGRNPLESYQQSWKEAALEKEVIRHQAGALGKVGKSMTGETVRLASKATPPAPLAPLTEPTEWPNFFTIAPSKKLIDKKIFILVGLLINFFILFMALAFNYLLKNQVGMYIGICCYLILWKTDLDRNFSEFVAGTLRFDNGYAEKLMAQGYLDGEAFSKNYLKPNE